MKTSLAILVIAILSGCGEPPATLPVDLMGQIDIDAIVHGEDEKAIESIKVSVTSAFPRGYQLALHDAAGLGRVQVVKAFIEAGIDVDCRDQLGKTPLMCCAGFWMNGSAQDHLGVAKLLLEHGADPDARTFRGDPIICGFTEPFTVDDILDRHFPSKLSADLKRLLIEHRMKRSGPAADKTSATQN